MLPFDDDMEVARGWLQPLDELRDLIELGGDCAQATVVCTIPSARGRLPMHAITMGNPDPRVPAIGVFGGVHGLERIGTEVVLAFLRGLLSRLRWDATLGALLERLRVVLMPLVNPGGMLRGMRSNPQGVDLMRNAPIECTERAPPMLRGQRLSRHLPWYRGASGASMEIEAQALCGVVQRELLSHSFAISVDCHSGFGLTDRIWFPYAHTARPIEELPKLLALSDLLDDNLVHHQYRFEPQSRQYLAHGDLWDYLHTVCGARHEGIFLPLTLEMGSWLWVKKNPRQMLSRQGLFNPLIQHRQHRVLRRHVALLEFFMRVAFNHVRWSPAGAQRGALRDAALARWYSTMP